MRDPQKAAIDVADYRRAIGWAAQTALRDVIGNPVLLPPNWIGMASWLDRNVMLDVTRDQGRNAPEWDTSQRIDRTAEEHFYKQYAWQGYWEQERVPELAS